MHDTEAGSGEAYAANESACGLATCISLTKPASLCVTLGGCVSDKAVILVNSTI
jgi:hypothetical protein